MERTADNRIPDHSPVPGVYLERIREAYFSDPGKRLRVARGTFLLRHGEPNHRLFYVLEGAFRGVTDMETLTGEEGDLELFRVDVGGFIGIHSFFAASGLSSVNVVADSDAELAWIDRATLPEEPDTHGSLKEQFFPLIMQEMDGRQRRYCRAAREREVYMTRLQQAEDMATLGQFAAGLAHELNNAIGVLMSASFHLRGRLDALLRLYDPGLVPWFERGYTEAHALSSAEVRRRARTLAKERGLEYEIAKELARMGLGGKGQGVAAALLRSSPDELDNARAAWGTGKDFRDIQFAASHAADIINSIKQISGGGQAERSPTDVAGSLRDSLTLLRNTIGTIEVVLALPDDMPLLRASTSELMQIWSNIIKNACEALREAGTPGPRIEINATFDPDELCVSIANNGPPIPEGLRDKLFQPSITTKRGKGSMGLGLGLYIAKRLVDSYDGWIDLARKTDETAFIICLPLQSGA